MFCCYAMFLCYCYVVNNVVIMFGLQVTGHSERSLANAHLENFKITPIYDPTFSQYAIPVA